MVNMTISRTEAQRKLSGIPCGISGIRLLSVIALFRLT